MDEGPTEMLDALKSAVRLIGSQSATGRLLGVSQAAVWGWLNEKLMLPAEHVLAVEAATGISRHRLRPDVYGPEPTDNTDPPPPFPDLFPRTVVPAPGPDAASVNPNGLEPSGSDRIPAEKAA